MLSLPFSLQGWTKMAERIRCPAPLPEDPAIPLLTKMLVPAPYQAPENKAKKKATGTRRSSRRPVSSDLPDGPNAPSASEDEEEEEEDASPPPAGGGKKRKAAPTGEAGRSKKGKPLLPDYAPHAEDGKGDWPSGVKPLAKS